MIAENGKTYAQILHNKCHWIFTADDLPEWNNEQCHAVDVTGNVPAVGDIWSGTSFAPPILTMSQTIASYEAALDRHLDSVAQQYRFADRTRLALRAGYPNDWRVLGTAFGTWMDQCNALCAVAMGEVIAGTRPLPSLEEFIDALPDFVAPVTP